MRLKSIYIFMWSIIFLAMEFTACLNASNSKNTKGSISTLPKVNNFYIFKKNMSLHDIISLLDEKKIRYNVIDPTKNGNNTNEEFPGIYPLRLNSFKGLKVINGFDLPVIGNILAEFKIGFYNDTILSFTYNWTKELNVTSDSDNISNKALSNFYDSAKNENDILRNLFDGLSHKCGNSISYLDNSKAYFPMTNSRELDYDLEGNVEYWEKEMWLSNDSDFYIQLQSTYSVDTTGANTFLLNKICSASILVLFNGKLANNLENIALTHDDEENKRREREKQINRKAKLREQNKRFDSL